jgi:hypothetical protein
MNTIKRDSSVQHWIDRLTGENLRKHALLLTAGQQNTITNMSWDALLQYIVLGDEAFTELQAENARLREALELVVEVDERISTTMPTEIIQKCKAALGEAGR